MKFHEFFFWLLIFFLPTQLGKHFWPDFSLVFGLRVDYLSPTIYLTDILVVLTLIFWGIEKLKNSKFKITNLKYPFKNLRKIFLPLLVFCFFFTNVFLAQNQGAALYKFFKIIEFSLLGFYIAKNHYLLVNNYCLLSLAVVYSSLIAVFQFLKQGSLGGIFYWFGERSFNIQTPGIALGEIFGKQFLRPYSIFPHPNSLAGFMLISLILILPCRAQCLVFRKILKRITVGLGIMALVFSFSRAVWLTGLLVFLFLAIVKKRYSLFLLSCLLSAGFLELGLLRMNEESIGERLQLVQVAFEMIKSAPLTGVGLNNFVVRLPEYWQAGMIRLLQPVHNIYLLVASETGLVGLVLFLWFLTLTYKRLLKIASYQLLIVLTAILLLGLFDHYWFTLQQNQLLATIVFGLAWSKMGL